MGSALVERQFRLPTCPVRTEGKEWRASISPTASILEPKGSQECLPRF
jgi:hypothetical protein